MATSGRNDAPHAPPFAERSAPNAALPLEVGGRHTWASWHVQNGTQLFALQELGGWESTETVRRYAHLTADHLAPYADRLCALRAGESSDHGAFTTQA